MTSDDIERIEAGLLRHPSVQEVCVMAFPKRRSGKGMKAFVVLRPNENISSKEICRFFCKEDKELLDESSVVFLPQLPRTSTGAVSRRRLLEMYCAQYGMVATAFWAVRVAFESNADEV